MYDQGVPPHRENEGGYRNNRDPEHRRPPFDEQYNPTSGGRGRRERDDRDREMRQDKDPNNRRY